MRWFVNIQYGGGLLSGFGIRTSSMARFLRKEMKETGAEKPKALPIDYALFRYAIKRAEATFPNQEVARVELRDLGHDD